MASSALACATVRGKPSRMKPLAQSGSSMRSAMMPTTISSETRPPAFHHRLGLEADRRSRLDRRAQHVAGRELRNADISFPDASIACLCRRPAVQAESASFLSSPQVWLFSPDPHIAGPADGHGFARPYPWSRSPRSAATFRRNRTEARIGDEHFRQKADNGEIGRADHRDARQDVIDDIAPCARRDVCPE